MINNPIFTHRSIRKYKPDPIPEDILARILDAGSRASTTGNMQVYSMIVSTTPEIKEKLWQVHFRQDMVKQAPVVITFCADFNRFNKWCRLRSFSRRSIWNLLRGRGFNDFVIESGF